MEFDFEMAFRPGKYSKEADARPRLPPMVSEIQNKNAAVIDDVPAYRMVGKLSESNDASKPNEEVVEPLPTITKQKEAQANDMLCQILKNILQKGRTFTVNGDTLLWRKVPIDGTIQIFVPECYKRTLLYHRLYLTLVGHPRTRWMYDVLRRSFNWPHMASGVHKLVFKCEWCRRHRRTQKHQRWLQLFSPCTSLEFIAVDILEPLTTKKPENRFTSIMKDRYSKSTRAIPVPKTAALLVAMTVLENWSMPYSKPNTIVTDSGLQFVSK